MCWVDTDVRHPRKEAGEKSIGVWTENENGRMAPHHCFLCLRGRSDLAQGFPANATIRIKHRAQFLVNMCLHWWIHFGGHVLIDVQDTLSWTHFDRCTGHTLVDTF